MKKQLQRHPSHSQHLGKQGLFCKYFHTLKPSTAQNLQLLWLGRSSSVCTCKIESEHYIRIQKKSFQVSLSQSNRLHSAIRMGKLHLVGINLVRDFKINHRLSFSASRGSGEDTVEEIEFMSMPASSENPAFACHLVWPSKTRGSFNQLSLFENESLCANLTWFHRSCQWEQKNPSSPEFSLVICKVSSTLNGREKQLTFRLQKHTVLFSVASNDTNPFDII